MESPAVSEKAALDKFLADNPELEALTARQPPPDCVNTGPAGKLEVRPQLQAPSSASRYGLGRRLGYAFSISRNTDILAAGATKKRTLFNLA